MVFIFIKTLWKHKRDRRRNYFVNSSTNRLPPEIIEIIIDYLHNDPHVLSICSLVCKVWLAICREHRFGKVILRQQNFKGFLGLLRSSQFSAHVRSRALDMTMVQDSKTNQRWLRHCIPRMGRFSATHLYIKGLGTDRRASHSYPENPLLVIGFQSVTYLTLVEPVFQTISQFVDVMCGLGNLERLSLSVISFDSRIYPLKALTYGEKRFPQKLQELQLLNPHPYDGMGIYHWLATCRPALAPIHTFDLQVSVEYLSPDIREMFWDITGGVLLNFGPLKHLIIGSFGLAATDVLSYNDALLSLHLDNINLRVSARTTPTYYQDPRACWRWVSELLGQVVSPYIQVVIFAITVDDVDELEVLNWERIALSFSQPQFSQLRNIHFMMSRLEGVERRIHEKLPECLERGIIQISQLR